MQHLEARFAEGPQSNLVKRCDYIHAMPMSASLEPFGKTLVVHDLE